MKIFLFLFIMITCACKAYAQCDLGTGGITIVNASNTATVGGGCIGVTYNLKFNIVNFGTGCSIQSNSATVSLAFPTISGGIKPFVYNGPLSFLTNYFTWTYDSFFEQLIGVNHTAIPAGNGDYNILVPVIGNATGSASSPLNISSGGNSNSSLANDNASVLFSVSPAPVVSDQPDQSRCNNGSFTMTQSGSGSWSLVSGTANITNPASPVTTVTAVPVGTSAVVKWNVTSASCTVGDEVTLTNNALPLLSVTGVVNNTCHGGNTGSISVTGGLGYSFTIAGPTVNTTGQATGQFTGLTAGNYAITVSAPNGCSNSTNATVNQPAGTVPDISLGSDYSSNLFGVPGEETTIVFNISEIGGNPATGDTIRIIRIPGYSMLFDPSATNYSVGSVNYNLDNSRWKLDETAGSFVSLIYDPLHNNTAGTINCGSIVFLSMKLKRNTANISTFSLSARLRRTNNELALTNNLNAIVFAAE